MFQNYQTTQLLIQHSQRLLLILAIVICLYFFKRYTSGKYFDTYRYDLTNKNAVITGGNSGIGKQTFLELVRLNCNVIIGARDRRKCQQALKQAKKIIQQVPSQSNGLWRAPIIPTIEYFPLDLGDTQSISEFATFVKNKFSHIDYLVNNAGLSLLPQKKTTQNGYQMSYGVNHLGHFYLTKLLFDQLKKSKRFRIINVSSIAHRRWLGFGWKIGLDWDNVNFLKDDSKSYEQNLAYSRSKLYNVLFTKSLAKKIDKQKGIAVSLHPGVVRSDITRHNPIFQVLIKIFSPVYYLFTKSNKQGAQTILYTILSQNVQSGQFYSDCEKSYVNEVALIEQNQQKLWELSQRDLGITFNISFQ